MATQVLNAETVDVIQSLKRVVPKSAPKPPAARGTSASTSASRSSCARSRWRARAAWRSGEPERPVLRLRGGVLELEGAEPIERGPHARGEEAEPLQVRDDPREDHPPEELCRLRGEDDVAHLVAVPAHGGRDLVAAQAVPHELAGLNDEVLSVVDLARVHVAVVLREREHAEGDVAGLVLHHEADQLLQQRLLRD